ncbi:MAG: hypothetical protein WC299_04335 [Kiritimatiellia bacterium]
MNVQKQRELEQKSSAVTLSDMEIFVFPELMYALLLANLMSPRIWSWRSDKWFEGLEKMKPYRRILRLKQFIMDHYAFNLDLDTWGLTTKERELGRFKNFIAPGTLRQSNALFGYEGDKYYFDIDIRKHFGLDKYSGNVIPYWKTETVEAMDAFRFKPEYRNGAGECVSLAALYAAALFIVARIPLSSIFMMATPLHSQNFVDLDSGILTNNRRLVTKQMWFNGTALSAQARRAIENERVTVVSHETGWIHAVFKEATIDAESYGHFGNKLRDFLNISLTPEILGNFVRHRRDLQKCFFIRHKVRGSERYISAERAFAYEEDSSFHLTDGTRDKLLSEIDQDEFQPPPLPGGIVLNDLEEFLVKHKIDLNAPRDVEALSSQFACSCLNAKVAMEQLIKFCRVVPALPEAGAKQIVPRKDAGLGLDPGMEREELVARIAAARAFRPEADLAFYAGRDLNLVEAEPFLLAAMERSPVSIVGAAKLGDDELIAMVEKMPVESIYDGDGRLAQPDEVWNFGRGDGLEKALMLANILHARRPGEAVAITVSEEEASLDAGRLKAAFATGKKLKPCRWDLSAYVSPPGAA